MQRRPVFLNLFQIRFPLTAIVSILHRVSGVLVFLLIPGILWIWEHSLTSQKNLDNLQIIFNKPSIKLITFITIAALIYHFIAGLRHIIMDFGWADSKRAGKIGAILVLLISMLIIFLFGMRLW